MDTAKILFYKLIRLCMRLFCLFPIKDNRIMFESYRGKSYSCNPKYIFEYLFQNYSNQYEMIWVLNKSDTVALPSGVRTVKKKSLMNIYYHMTAKCIISNMTDDVYIPLRKKQVFINTWHAGGAYKKVGLSYDKTLSKLTEWQDSIVRDETTYYVSSSELFTKYNIVEAYNYHGKVINSGMPRNDLFFNKDKRNSIGEAVRRKYKIMNKLVILYAPTFRGDFRNAREMNCSFPFDEITKAFAYIGRDVAILKRAHYNTSNYELEGGSVTDVTDYPDMQELLAAADILITDYSSSIWDFSLTKKPCILFIPDKEDYLFDRGVYTPIDKWPGLVVMTKEDLVQSLLCLDYEKCKRKAEDALNYYHSYEDGNACKKVCRIIEEVCKNGTNK